MKLYDRLRRRLVVGLSQRLPWHFRTLQSSLDFVEPNQSETVETESIRGALVLQILNHPACKIQKHLPCSSNSGQKDTQTLPLLDPTATCKEFERARKKICSAIKTGKIKAASFVDAKLAFYLCARQFGRQPKRERCQQTAVLPQTLFELPYSMCVSPIA